MKMVFVGFVTIAFQSSIGFCQTQTGVFQHNLISFVVKDIADVSNWYKKVFGFTVEKKWIYPKMTA